jgi:hypothetical protein
VRLASISGSVSPELLEARFGGAVFYRAGASPRLHDPAADRLRLAQRLRRTSAARREGGARFRSDFQAWAVDSDTGEVRRATVRGSPPAGDRRDGAAGACGRALRGGAPRRMAGRTLRSRAGGSRPRCAAVGDRARPSSTSACRRSATAAFPARRLTVGVLELAARAPAWPRASRPSSATSGSRRWRAASARRGPPPALRRLPGRAGRWRGCSAWGTRRGWSSVLQRGHPLRALASGWRRPAQRRGRRRPRGRRRTLRALRPLPAEPARACGCATSPSALRAAPLHARGGSTFPPYRRLASELIAGDIASGPRGAARSCSRPGSWRGWPRASLNTHGRRASGHTRRPR